jgi:hypothetical protein
MSQHYEPLDSHEEELHRRFSQNVGDTDRYRILVTNKRAQAELIGRFIATIDVLRQDNERMALQRRCFERHE